MNHMYKHSWCNTHEDLMQSSTHKGYRFYTDLFIEEPFYKEVVDALEGKIHNYKVKGNPSHKCICPSCKTRSGFITPYTKHNTYSILCPNDDCKYPNGRNTMFLHELIMYYGSDDIKNRWRNARWTKVQPYGWNPIKNRKVKSQSQTQES